MIKHQAVANLAPETTNSYLGFHLVLPSCWSAPVNINYKEMDFPIGHNSMNQEPFTFLQISANQWLNMEKLAPSILVYLPA